ncbi:MAG: hypothetical protein ABJF01_21320 [bacterium]
MTLSSLTQLGWYSHQSESIMRHAGHGFSIPRAFLAGYLILCSACSSTVSATDVPTSEASRAIVGRWTFVRACGGLAPTCRSIGQTTEPTEYVFRSNGTVTLTPQVGGPSTRNYIIVPGSKDDPRATLTIGGGPLVDPRPLLVSFAGDTLLTLDEGCCDRFAIDYRRAP